jgi:hypothetical protein
LSTSSADKDEWDDFNGFQESETPQCANTALDDVLPKICANTPSASFDVRFPSTLQTTSGADRTVCEFNDIMKRCFCRSSGTVMAHDDRSAGLSVASLSQEEFLCGNQIWQTVINNVYNVLPVDWSTTHARQLQQNSLNISSVNEHEQTSAELDLSDDEELQQAFDAHSLIVSTIHQEPIFTAEQVIKEIEDMLEVEDSSPSVADANQDELYSLELLRMRELSQARISATKESIEGMKTSSLCELYDEMDGLVRELSEELVQQLARRDELEYEKELKNQFISLLLSIQRRHRDLIGNKSHHGLIRSAESSAASQPGCYLTTLIPYDPKMVPPTIEHLQIYVKILSAINDDSPTVPALLTDYILKVICPKV